MRAITTDSPEIMVDIIKVSKTYPPNVQALTDVSISIKRGEIVFLTGMSGAGKTTLLRLLTRIERPTKGLVEVAGMDLGKLPRNAMQTLRRSIGVAFQEFKLLPDRTAAENIAITMEVAYKRPTHIRRRARKLLEQLGLAEKYHTLARELSRGEQQRVSIARAVANDPDLILADEPTGNLDHETTGLVMDLFRQHNARGATLVIATHDESIYQHSGHRVIELSSGRHITHLRNPLQKRRLPSIEELPDSAAVEVQ